MEVLRRACTTTQHLRRCLAGLLRTIRRKPLCQPSFRLPTLVPSALALARSRHWATSSASELPSPSTPPIFELERVTADMRGHLRRVDAPRVISCARQAPRRRTRAAARSVRRRSSRAREQELCDVQKRRRYRSRRNSCDEVRVLWSSGAHDRVCASARAEAIGDKGAHANTSRMLGLVQTRLRPSSVIATPEDPNGQRPCTILAQTVDRLGRALTASSSRRRSW